MIIHMMFDQRLPRFQVFREQHIVFVLGKYLDLAKLWPEEVVDSLYHFDYEAIEASQDTF